MKAPTPDPTGTVYLLHFDQPYRHARHYLGYTENLPERLEQHRKGTGARLMEVMTSAGIGFSVAKTWQGTRTMERAKKSRGEGRICPLCQAQLSLQGCGERPRHTRALRRARLPGRRYPVRLLRLEPDKPARRRVQRMSGGRPMSAPIHARRSFAAGKLPKKGSAR